MHIHFMDLLIGAVFGQLLKLSEKEILGEFGLNLEVYVDMLIYLLTAIELTPADSSTVHIYSQTIHRTTQLIWKARGQCPVFASYTLSLLYN